MLSCLLRVLFVSAGLGLAATAWCAPAPSSASPFRVQVVDEATGRGVPLVELQTTHQVVYLTDNQGLVAFAEPGLLGQRVFFTVRSHGYELPKDGFGYAGVALDTRPGGGGTIKLKRRNVAERLYRITGAGCYRDTVLLGEPPPVPEPVLNAQVVGQDSSLAAVYRGQVYWFWGDTTPAKYPLGNFLTTGATSALPGPGGLNPATGIALRYFTNSAGFCRAMAPVGGEGVVWLDGLLVVADDAGRERMVAHFSRRQGLAKELEHGLVQWNDERAEFEKVLSLKAGEEWRCPRGHPVRVAEAGTDYFYFLQPDRAVRVKAELGSVLNPAAYEAYTCLAPGAGAAGTNVARDAQGRLAWSWQRELAPLRQPAERLLIERGQMQKGEARYQFHAAGDDQPVNLHAGSVNWNEYRRKWIVVAVQQGGTSFLGEVWYGEADSPVGPWGPLVKVVTHERYSFYNPVQRPFLDETGGRFIYFEGTYAQTFSGNPVATPWYDYNQIMYRLDLGDSRLAAARQ